MRISIFYRLLLLFIFAVQYINKVKPFLLHINLSNQNENIKINCIGYRSDSNECEFYSL